jgi:PAS domain S-box-containing protein
MNATPLRPDERDARVAPADATAARPSDETALLEAVGDGVVVLRQDTDGLVVEWSSERFRALIGRDSLPAGTPASFLSCPINRRTLAAVPCTDALPPKAWLDVSRPDGRRVSIDATCRPIAGARYVLTCTQRDEEDPVAAFTEGAGIAFFSIDVAGKRLEANDALYAMLGRDGEAERRRPDEERWAIVHPDDVPAVRADFHRLAADPSSRSDSEFRLAAADGNWLWVLQRSRVVAFDAAGRAARISGIVIDVDRRKRAERGLAQSESRYRTLVGMTPGLLHESEYDSSGRYVVRWASDGLMRLLGWSIDELNARGAWPGILHPADRADADARRARILSGSQERAELRLLTKSGKYVWVTSVSCPLQDPETGRISSLLGAMYDVTHLKETESALRESEERFRLAAEAVNGIIYDWDARTGVVTRSRGMQEVLGYAPDALPPTRDAWRALIHRDDVRVFAGSADAGRSASRLSDARYRIRHAAGHWVDVWDRSKTLYDDAGRMIRIVGCSVDVTPLRRFERMLDEAEAIAHVGSWEVDVATERVSWSPETFRIHELPVGSAPPTLQDAVSFYAPEYRDAIRSAVDRGLTTGAPWELDLEIVTARGHRRWVRASGRAETVDGRVVRLYGALLDIDTLKRTQLQLQQQGDWLRMSIDASNLAAWRWFPATDECVIEYRSGSMHGATELSSLAAWLSVVDPADRARVGAALTRTARDGTPTNEEYRVHEPGGLRWLVTRATRAEGAHGVVVTGTTQDITARRAADERVRASEALLRSITDIAPDFISVVGADLRLRFVNRALGDVAAEEAVGRPVAEFVIGDDDPMLDVLRRVLATGEPARYESCGLIRDATVHYEHRATALRHGDAVEAVVVYSTNVTARLEAERRLRTQASVLATMREGVVVVDAGGGVHLTNPAFDRMFGHEPGAPDGRSIAEVVGSHAPWPDDDRASFEFVGRRADGTRVEAAAVASRLQLGGEAYAVYVVQDVTERRALERELLEISNREQRRIGSDLHDGLGQELTGVALMLRGLASRVKRGQPATTGDLDELVALVNGAIESTRSLARGLSPVELERGGLVFALRSLCVRARELYGLDVRFRSRVWPELALDAAATTHLYRIAQEALTNAARHAQASHVAVTLNVRGTAVTLTVADDGRGMPQEHGTGMGLKIMRYRAQMMGGEVCVGASDPQGTRVTCRVRQPPPVRIDEAATA